MAAPYPRKVSHLALWLNETEEPSRAPLSPNTIQTIKRMFAIDPVEVRGQNARIETVRQWLLANRGMLGPFPPQVKRFSYTFFHLQRLVREAAAALGMTFGPPDDGLEWLVGKVFQTKIEYDLADHLAALRRISSPAPHP